MAVAVYISSERGATEVAIDSKSTKEIVLVGQRFPGAVPVRIVGRAIPGVKVVRIVGEKFIVQGEVL
jgi:hypothetical protein